MKIIARISIHIHVHVTSTESAKDSGEYQNPVQPSLNLPHWWPLYSINSILADWCTLNTFGSTYATGMCILYTVYTYHRQGCQSCQTKDSFQIGWQHLFALQDNYHLSTAFAQDIMRDVFWSTAKSCAEKPSCATFFFWLPCYILIDSFQLHGFYSLQCVLFSLRSILSPCCGLVEWLASGSGHHMLTPLIKDIFSLECTMRQMWLMCLWVLRPITRSINCSMVSLGVFSYEVTPDMVKFDEFLEYSYLDWLCTP